LQQHRSLGQGYDRWHLYQTRKLDWSMKVGAHNYPVIVVYVPNEGIPHVIPSFPASWRSYRA